MAEESKGGGERSSRRRRGRGSKSGGSKSGPKGAERRGGDGDDAGGDGDRKDGRRGRSRRGRRARTSGGDVEELGASTGIDVIDRPAEGRRRRGGLEPGLTLKDLLPFLRPPKTVLVLGASTGGGHNRTASALVEAFKGIDRNLVVRHHDVLDLLDKGQDSSAVRRLLEDQSRSESLFGTPFDTVEGEPDGASAAIDEILPKLFGKRMDQMLVDKRPDHVVCTHWLALRHMEKLKEEERFTASVTAAIPDPDVCDRWVSDLVAHYLVSEDGLKARLQRAGVDPSMITVTGTPVSPLFVEAVDRDAVARELGIRTSNPTVLLRPGGIGSTERILGVVKSILEAHAPTNLLVLAGKNDALREQLESVETEGGSVVKGFGFVQNIHELMGISDLLISRASPHTMAEACAAGLPALLLRPSPGIEERMADRLLRFGCAAKAYGERDLDFLVRELLKNRRYLKEMQDAAEKRRRPDAAHLAVERISKIVK